MKPRCIFKYLTQCKINPNPPGFADCIRGIITCYLYSKKYNYDFLISKSVHPIFQFFKNTPYFIEDKIDDTIELIAPLSYEQIDMLLENLFKIGHNFSVLTNSFYKNDRNELEWFGKIDKDVQLFIKFLFLPNDEISEKIRDIFTYVYNFNCDTNYNIIHLRTMELEDNRVRENIVEITRHFYEKICPIVKTSSEKFILITDSETIGLKLCELIPELNYWNNKKGHTGVFTDDIDSIRDSMIDFFIMTKAKKIYTVVDKYGNRSGYCKIASIIYDIEYNVI